MQVLSSGSAHIRSHRVEFFSEFPSPSILASSSPVSIHIYVAHAHTFPRHTHSAPYCIALLPNCRQLVLVYWCYLLWLIRTSCDDVSYVESCIHVYVSSVCSHVVSTFTKLSKYSYVCCLWQIFDVSWNQSMYLL